MSDDYGLDAMRDMGDHLQIRGESPVFERHGEVEIVIAHYLVTISKAELLSLVQRAYQRGERVVVAGPMHIVIAREGT
jgi:hypothetical protein